VLATAGLAQADAVTDWNRTATTAGAEISPLAQSRLFAMVHAAIYDAVNSIQHRGSPYILEASAASDASPEAAVAAAARGVLFALVESRRTEIEAAYQAAIADVPNLSARTAGINVGRMAAASILARRQNDGAGTVVAATPGVYPGQYRPTPPANLPAAFAQWGRVTPFAIRFGDQFRTLPPPDLFSRQYALDLNEVRLIGSEDSKTRTAEQSEIARFWYEGSPQGWNRIARNAAGEQTLDLWESARLFALLNVAMADGFIAGFDSKYYYNFWRPVTAIREGYTDGNMDTEGYPQWNTFLVTPNSPDWPSTHSVLGAAAATVLRRVFGTDYVTFNMTSGAPFPGITRQFRGFWAAAQENADSRVLAESISARRALLVSNRAEASATGWWSITSGHYASLRRAARPLPVCRDARNALTDHQQMDMLGSFISLDRLQIAHVPHDRILIHNPVGTEQVA
jgi:hypothetical protein